MGQRGEGKGTLRTFIFSFIIGGNKNGDVGLQICFEYGRGRISAYSRTAQSSTHCTYLGNESSGGISSPQYRMYLIY